MGVTNALEFIITPGCEITIKPRNAVVSNLRMEMTMDDFYNGGGVTKFQDNIAAALGIHADRVKVV